MLAQRLVAAEQFVRAQQQLGEIDDAFPLALVVVEPIDLDELRVEVVIDLDVLRAETLLLAAVDEPGRLARGIALFVEAVRLQQALDGGDLVAGIEDLERLW
jgi:hypothetical protein